MPESPKLRCPHCRAEIARPGLPVSVPRPANDNGVIWIAPDRRLRNLEYVLELARHLLGLGLSRREIGNWLAETIFDFVAKGGLILAVDGRPHHVGDIDDAFNGDGSWRWMGCFLRWPAAPPKQRPQGRTLARLRLIDLAVRIDRMNRRGHPDV